MKTLKYVALNETCNEKEQEEQQFLNRTVSEWADRSLSLTPGLFPEEGIRSFLGIHNYSPKLVPSEKAQGLIFWHLLEKSCFVIEKFIYPLLLSFRPVNVLSSNCRLTIELVEYRLRIETGTLYKALGLKRGLNADIFPWNLIFFWDFLCRRARKYLSCPVCRDNHYFLDLRS